MGDPVQAAVQTAAGDVAAAGLQLISAAVVTPLRTFLGTLLARAANDPKTTPALTAAQAATGSAAAALTALSTAEAALTPAIAAGGDVLINIGLGMIPGGVGSEFDGIADLFWNSVIAKATAQLSANKPSP